MNRLLGLLIVLSLLVAGCSAARVQTQEGGGSTGFTDSPPVGAKDAFSSEQGPQPLASPIAGAARSSSAGSPAATPPDQPPSVLDRMIVYNANISMGVKSVSEAIASIRGLADGVGGFVTTSNSGYVKDKESSSITIRVPASAYNQVMTDLRKLAVKVNSENDSARDVTEEFADLDAQLRNFRVTEAQFQELMRRANTIDEILKVQAQLTQVRGQIERLQGRMNVLQRTSDMATIVVNLSPAETPTPEPPTWDPGRTIDEAWQQSLVWATKVADLSLRVMVFAVWFLPPTIMMLVFFWLIRRLTARPTATIPTITQS